jgi:hypothetical protein
VEPGPLPPHERAWRHPSELPPPPHEPTTPAGKALIVTSAAVGLIMVGLLAMTMTPDRGAAPAVVASTASPVRAAAAVAVSVVPPSGAAGGAAVRSDVAAMSVVTPVGDEGLGVTTLEAVAGLGGALMARLPSGEAIRVVVVATDEASGLALVALPASARGRAFRMADDPPEPDDTVVVHGVVTTVVAIVELADLDVAEGTPVLDADGELVGLCSGAEDGTRLVPLTSGPEEGEPAPSSTAEPATSSSPPTSVAGDPTSTTSTVAGEVSSAAAASGPQD